MTKTTIIITILIILGSFVLGFYFYPYMPDKMASHWNINGEVDDYMSRFWGTFLMPIVTLAMFLLFIWLPRIDPLKENVQKFRKYFDGFILFIIAFFFYVYLLTIAWNLGRRFDMGQVIIPAIGVLFYYCGILVQNAKRNWFIGIRTPWTLSSDRVWDRTHQLGGKLFKAFGVIALLGIVLPRYSFWFVIIGAIAASVFTTIYSYLEYQKEKIGH